MKIMTRLCLLLSFIFALQAQAEEYTAQYRVTFTGEWTLASHPDDFPGGAHFSPLIGSTHNESGSIWQAAESASNGMEQMAETGGTGTLTNQINNMIANIGSAENLITGLGNIGAIGSEIILFEISESHPLFSIVTMIAPSPDWFVGVHGTNLLQNGAWVESLVVPLLPYDAGTDNGRTFTSGNSNTSPQELIQLLTQAPLPNNIPLAELTFELISSTGIPGFVFADSFE